MSSWRRADDTMAPPRAKITGLYVNSALAKSEAVENGYDEAILLSHDGHVAEGSAENVFLVRRGVLYTPDPSQNVLEGCTRRAIMDIARDEFGLQVVERSIDRGELYSCRGSVLHRYRRRRRVHRGDRPPLRRRRQHRSDHQESRRVLRARGERPRAALRTLDHARLRAVAVDRTALAGARLGAASGASDERALRLARAAPIADVGRGRAGFAGNRGKRQAAGFAPAREPHFVGVCDP